MPEDETVIVKFLWSIRSTLSLFTFPISQLRFHTAMQQNSDVNALILPLNAIKNSFKILNTRNMPSLKIFKIQLQKKYRIKVLKLNIDVFL